MPRITLGLYLLLALPLAHAFVVPRSFAPSTTLASDFGTAMPEPVSIYDQIGIGEEDLALGVDPREFYNYIGT